MIGYPLTDSPAGQLAWALARTADWTHGPIDQALSREQIITTVMMYWTTRTAASAARIYYEKVHAGGAWGRPPSQDSVAVAVFAEDVAICRCRPPYAARSAPTVREPAGAWPPRGALSPAPAGIRSDYMALHEGPHGGVGVALQVGW